MHFISYILPVYNSAGYLRTCLEALLACGTGDCEIILVDDGSTDGCPAIEQEYAERYPFIRVLRQNRGGPSAARNAGLACSTGEYVAFLDSDDYIDAAALRRTLDCLRSREADMLCSDFHRVSDNGTVFDRVYQIEADGEAHTGPGAMRRYVNSGDCVWNVWRCIFKRSFLERNGLRFLEGYHCAEDLEFVVRALSATEQIVFYHNPYYSYRVNYGNSLTRRYSAQRARELMVMLRKAADTLGKSNSVMKPGLQRMLAREYLLNLTLCAECPRGERKQAADELKAGVYLADYAAGSMRIVRAALKCLGVPVTARLLLLLKKVKRLMRAVKERGSVHNA